MDFTTIGSIGQYTKNMSMQVKWQNRQKSGNYEPEKKDTKDSVSEWIEEQKKKAGMIADESDDEKTEDKSLKAISDKLSRGEKLTYFEKQYLKKKDPKTYQKVIDTEIEQAYYEQQLRRCRTKDEFQRMKAARAAASLGTVNRVMNNPHITQEKKLEVISGEQMKAAAAERTEREFMRCGNYTSLPTESEKRYAEKKLAEAERNERRSKKDETKEEVVREEPKITEKDRKSVKVKVKTSKKKYRIKRGITKAQAEMLPEVRKTKRSRKKQKAAFTAGTVEFSAAVTVKTLDIKA